MAKKSKQTSVEVKSASFKDATTAALFGVDIRELGEVTFHQNGIITVAFQNTTAQRVCDALFVIVEPTAQVEATDESEDYEGDQNRIQLHHACCSVPRQELEDHHNGCCPYLHISSGHHGQANSCR